MQRVIAGATGLIGTALVNHWLMNGHHVTVIGRSRQKIQTLFQNRVNALEWHELEPNTFEQTEMVVNLSGAGIAEKRWTRARKNEILHSRIEPTQQLVKLLQSLGHQSPPLFNASAIGIYGLQRQTPPHLPPRLDEQDDIPWDHPPDFLSQVGCAWEKAANAAKPFGIRVVNLRFGVVLAKQGGALPQIVRPFYFFAGGRIGTGYQPFSWITIDDLIKAIDFLIPLKDIDGPINFVAPQCVTQRTLAKTIGQVIHKPSMLITPSLLLKCLFGEMASELLLEGQHVYPSRLLDLGFHFSHPDLQSALVFILK